MRVSVLFRFVELNPPDGSQQTPVPRSHQTPGRSKLKVVSGIAPLGVVLALLRAESSLSTPSEKNGGLIRESGLSVNEVVMSNTSGSVMKMFAPLPAAV